MAFAQTRRQPAYEGHGIVGAIAVLTIPTFACGSGAEGWIDVDQRKATVLERRQDLAIVSADELAIPRAPGGVGSKFARMVEHNLRAPYHRGVTTNFCPWYSLSEASDKAPDAPGVFQVRVSEGLIDYPSGKSAMVHYGFGADLAAAILEFSRDHGRADLLCRHQVCDVPEQLFETVLSAFRRRFGSQPTFSP